MKKRRSTVPVSPGKDVTLYVPSDTPREVIDYMNRLKADGVFSQGIMDILTKHILHEHSTSSSVGDDVSDSAHGFNMIHDDPLFVTEAVEAQENYENTMSEVSEIPMNFSLDQIFRQAGRNAGKLLHEIDHDGRKPNGSSSGQDS